MNATDERGKVSASRNRLRHFGKGNRTEHCVEKSLDAAVSVPPSLLTPPLLAETSGAESSSVGSSSYIPYPTPSPSSSSVTSGSEFSQSHYQSCHAVNTNNCNSSIVEMDLPSDCRLLQPSSSNPPPPLITAEDPLSRTLSLDNTSKLCHVDVGPSISKPPSLIPLDGLNVHPYRVDMKAEMIPADGALHHHVGEQQQQQQIPIFSFAQEGNANLITIVQPPAEMALTAPGQWLAPVPQQHLAAGMHLHFTLILNVLLVKLYVRCFIMLFEVTKIFCHNNLINYETRCVQHAVSALHYWMQLTF